MNIPILNATTVVALVAATSVISPVVAQNYPAKPVRFIVGFPAGGTVDLVARGRPQGQTPLKGAAVQQVSSATGSDPRNALMCIRHRSVIISRHP